MLLISATGLFFSRKWIAEVFSPYFSHKPAAILSPEIATPPAPVASADTSAPATAQPTMPAVSSEFPAGETVDQVAVTPADSSTPAPAGQTAQSTDSTVPPARGALRLEIGISENCWVSVDRDGSPALRKLMTPGEIQSVDANEQFLLIVGNAGGVHLKINGKPAKPLGKSGEVVRILINGNNLQDLLDQTAG